MDYLLMCCFDESEWARLPESERAHGDAEYGEFQRNLVATGHYRGVRGSSRSSTATTVRERNGRPIITDGPFAETKEQLGGYHVVDVQGPRRGNCHRAADTRRSGSAAPSRFAHSDSTAETVGARA